MTLFVHPDDPSYTELEAERDALRAELGSTKSELVQKNERLTAELNRERASLAAACEASDKRAAALNREVIADNERLQAERDALRAELLQVQGWQEARDNLLAGYNKTMAANEQLRAEVAEWQQSATEAACMQDLREEQLTELREQCGALLLRNTELREAAEAVEQMWRDYNSQEMYGEMLREGMGWGSENEPGDPSDFERWDNAHTTLRDVLAKVTP